MRWTAFLPLIAFVAVLGAFIFGLGNDPSHLPSVLLDKPVPEFTLPKIAGIESPGFSTEDFQTGKPIVLNVFASWCAPCRAEHPVLEMLVNDHDITLYGMNYKDRPEDARRFLDALGNPYTKIGVDIKGKTGIDLGVYGVPETFIIRGDGTIAYRHAGPLLPQDVERVILPILQALEQENANS